MKKIALVLPNNIYLAPYINKYISILNNSKVDLLYWDRFDMEESIDGLNKIYRYMEKMSHINQEVSQYEKLKKYCHFAKFVHKICQKEKYDNIIIFQPIMALIYKLLGPFASLKNVIIDVRDFTYEGSAFFRFIEKNMFRKCQFVVISSPWYKDFLPKKAKYVIMENINKVSVDLIKKTRTEEKRKDKVSIGYIGLIRFIEQNKKIIEKFANDERFQLFYIGKGAELLTEYIDKNKIKNVTLIPQFAPKETEKHFASVDIIQNIYGTGRDKLKYALSNKLYYAAILGKPILVSPNTCMEKVSSQYQFGMSCDENDVDLANKVYQFYQSLNWGECHAGCDKFIADVNDNEKLMISSFEELQIKN